MPCHLVSRVLRDGDDSIRAPGRIFSEKGEAAAKLKGRVVPVDHEQVVECGHRSLEAAFRQPLIQAMEDRDLVAEKYAERFFQ